MEIIVFALIFIICFFLLYLFSKHDFVLLRQNISMAQIFDALFVSILSAFIFGRVLYVVNNFKTELLSFLRFFHIIKYPGISFFGFVLGGVLCLYLIFMKKKGLGRIADIFTISFFPLFMASMFYDSVKLPVLVPVILLVLNIFFFIYFLRSHQKYILRDGSVSLIFFILLCVETFLIQYLSKANNAVFLQFTLLGIICLLFIPFILIDLFINQKRKKS